jgi:hypothetical protein
MPALPAEEARRVPVVLSAEAVLKRSLFETEVCKEKAWCPGAASGLKPCPPPPLSLTTTKPSLVR